MTSRIGVAAILAGLLAGGLRLGAQETGKVVKLDDFEGETTEFTAMKLDATGVGADDAGKVTITREAAKVKAGKGSLYYSYDIVPGSIRTLALLKPIDLTGMKSLRLWVKCSASTAVVISLAEASGASYQTAAYCAAGTWQEIAVNLDELTADEPAKDPNGKLDLDQVGGITIFDIGGFVATFLPDLKGTRVMWVDDVGFSSVPLTATTGPAQVTKVVPIFLVDNFETSVIRWLSISLEFSETPKFNLFDAATTIDKDVPTGGGKQSLRFAYPRKGMKFHGVMRSLDKVDLSKAASLDLSLKSSHDGTIVVTIEEKDGSRYNKMVELLAGDWKSLSWTLAEFTKADDSQDENGRLDADQIKQISIGDITKMLGGADVEENRLWIDQVLFVLNP